uniref:Uncharacterized protein n=1 Tax=Lepeophtheirus salmonis TaxID=72036 RepID=A0A0K2TJZ1_LEPSM
MPKGITFAQIIHKFAFTVFDYNCIPTETQSGKLDATFQHRYCKEQKHKNRTDKQYIAVLVRFCRFQF